MGLEKVSFLDTFETLSDGVLTLRLTEQNPGDAVQLPYYYCDVFVQNRECAGKISIRVGENRDSYWNGHIGYEIDTPHRGHGYARRACQLVLPVARAHGMRRVIFTCAQSNAASRRTIETLGAALLEIAAVPENCFFWREGMERYCVYQLAI
ncbi:MAG: GNAT family N-acetyltransferase [Oscillospiraceae bacterium]|jgi:predicted acetyltransferase|nr:GNAT family N-acetyltransferase [Oscillospiraceae bacterium]